MSRFDCANYDGEGPPPEFWMRAVKNALQGRRGQAVLRELREALLSLPQPRLIEGSVVQNGEVCVIGALAAYRLRSGPLALTGSYRSGNDTVSSLKELQDRFGDWLDDEFGTVELGEAMGLRRALAWEIAYQNDEGGHGREMPEERWERVLGWVERQISNTGK